ncbi:hypothetical protein CIPAW_03G167000 [Carya illinoinensis]|uniref:Uncharacterized protein n=1 Tax=Carya illinoinensis TaxID=32201 RepID=A0A8T1R4Q0_CARIL|nr:hypothetical protein CIPAW_03G167000 [Carya illinoinensis]
MPLPKPRNTTSTLLFLFLGSTLSFLFFGLMSLKINAMWVVVLQVTYIQVSHNAS